MTQKQDRNPIAVDPKVLAALNEEVSFNASQQRGPRRIKLDKGENILARFLPARFGPNRLWYVRVAYTGTIRCR